MVVTGRFSRESCSGVVVTRMLFIMGEHVSSFDPVQGDDDDERVNREH